MIDNFKFQRTPKPKPKEEFSYHIWHIADGLNDEGPNSPSYFDSSFSQTFWNLTWDTIPTEIQSVSALFRSTECCSPNFSLIAQHQTVNDTPPSFSEILGAVFGCAKSLVNGTSSPSHHTDII